MTTLHATGIRCTIGAKTIVEGVDFRARAGELTALVGRNGSGKSTLLRALGGITTPAEGQVFLDDHELHRLRPAQRARQLAFVAQEEMPSAELLVGEFVALGRVPHRKPWEVGGAGERDLVRECLARVGMLDKIDRSCVQLSGGERRRAALARALAQQCDLMLLDEPTNHLDVESQLHLLRLLRESGRTVVAAIHDLDLAMRYFDAVYVLDGGRLVAAGAPGEALTADVIATAFHVDGEVVTTTGGQRHLVFEPLGAPANTGHARSASAPSLDLDPTGLSTKGES